MFALSSDMMDNNLFVYGIQAPDNIYNIIRDKPDPYPSQMRLFMENLWRKYQPYADKNFKQQLQVDFDSRFWEMYLACTLLENSIRLSSRSAGPDILIDHEDGRIWIEAIAPTSGADNNPDRVPDMKLGVATEVPGDEIILRYRAAIREKYDIKYQGYIASGLIKPTDSYVIAINGCKIGTAIMETEHPRILKAVLPIGDLQVIIDTKTGIVVDTKYQLRVKIKKASGADVRTDLFLNPEYASLSGIFYSCASVRKVPNKMGEDFVLIHNPLATNRLSYRFLKIGREYMATEDNGEYAINVTNWN
jgi:hypothetical protein